MAETTRDTPRVAWVDGLRGIAAMQVVLLHYACVFLPAIGFHESSLAHFGWESAFVRTPLDFSVRRRVGRLPVFHHERRGPDLRLQHASVCFPAGGIAPPDPAWPADGNRHPVRCRTVVTTTGQTP
jgi:hypothetical protein